MSTYPSSIVTVVMFLQKSIITVTSIHKKICFCFLQEYKENSHIFLVFPIHLFNFR